MGPAGRPQRPADQRGRSGRPVGQSVSLAAEDTAARRDGSPDPVDVTAAVAPQRTALVDHRAAVQLHVLPQRHPGSA